VVFVEWPGNTIHSRHVWCDGSGGVECLTESEEEDEGTEFGREEGEEGALELGRACGWVDVGEGPANSAVMEADCAVAGAILGWRRWHCLDGGM
jgi:hypothetical protein